MPRETFTNSSESSVKLIWILALLSTFGPLAIDMYLPSLPTIGSELNASAAQVQQTLSAFLVGFGLGQLFYGPLSDRYGRRPILLSGIALFSVTSALCGLAQDISSLTMYRFLHAVGGGAAIVIARAVVRDRFDTNQSARVLSTILMCTALAPLAAPIVGGFLLEQLGWRSIFWVLTGFGVLSFVVVAVGLEESNSAERRDGSSLATAFIRYRDVLGNRRLLGYMLASGFVYAGMFAYIIGTPFVYIEYFGVAPENYGFLFGLNIISIVITSRINVRYVGRVGAKKMMARGIAVSAVAGVLLAAVGWLNAGFEVGGQSWGLWLVVAPLLFFLGPISIVGANGVALASAEYPQAAGAVAALCGATQFGLGASAGTLMGLLGDGSPLGMCLVIGVCGVLAVISFCCLANR
ncbi:Bcr/CflA family multidrug efflux MFS transporter [Porticoccus sp. W117]|uniref:Bcr/CflA family multidrug efflux MFS transporter n=1 Tax=Porticoccus sp. W117 TaxID=3054777 RepID=UPI0025947D5B|nr:Bcr/CflA family multidrug efflux MFS transporter [Porticoccus sp. W117]MDM3871895.1 Bcr/CflA family multidrug efflux MFS transporter [Porticoccus sp. W117]